MNAFMNFDKFVTPAVVKIVYWIGIVGTVISGIIWAIAGFQYYGALAVVAAIIGIVFGLLLWRVYCELIMLWFKIYEELAGIRKNTAK